MKLGPGTRIGPFEILGLLGAGGMGEVYRARDTRLGRDVAVKTLPESFLTDPDRVARFEREAQILAALSHPHIAGIHGIEELGGSQFLILEYIPGETLAQRLAAAPLDSSESRTIARQIALALEAAHQKNIIHRDLKPANVMITPDGEVKVLDFGLARTAETQGLDVSSAAMTHTVASAHAGLLVGTAAYMPPEQVRGAVVDKRADIWAFGALVYEMLTGRQPFVGSTISDTVANVLTVDPDYERIQPEMQFLVRTCLQKDPKARFHDIADVRLLLEAAPARTSPGTGRAPGSWRAIAAVGTAAAALTAGLVSITGIRGTEINRTPVIFTENAPPNTHFTNLYSGVALSPDGETFAFSASGMLWVRTVRSVAARPLPHSQHASHPTFSPDGKSIAFFADGRLKRIALLGGTPEALCAASGTGLAWGSNGLLLFGTARGIHSVRESGGEPVRVTSTDGSRQERLHLFPQFLPDGRRFIYLVKSFDPEVQGVYAAHLDGRGDRVRVLRTARQAVYVPSAQSGGEGHLLWEQQQTLFAQRFDPDSLEFRGDPAEIARNVGVFPAGGTFSAFWASPAGVLIYRAMSDKNRLIWVDRTGSRLREAPIPSDSYRSFWLSPDERRVLVDRQDDQGSFDIHLLDLQRATFTRLTVAPGWDIYPRWAPDGRSFAFESQRDGQWQIYRSPIDGSGAEETLTSGPYRKFPLDWSPDGRVLIYHEGNPLSRGDIKALQLEGRSTFAVAQTPFMEDEAEFSPDGRWIVYVSDMSGREEVYIQPFPSGGRIQVSNDGGRAPRWSRDGSEIFYVTPGNRMMAVTLRRQRQQLHPESPRVLFEFPFPEVTYPYDVTSDGQRFLLLEPITPAERAAPLTVMMYWQQALQ